MCNLSCWYDVESTINNVASVAWTGIFENSLPQGLVKINKGRRYKKIGKILDFVLKVPMGGGGRDHRFLPILPIFLAPSLNCKCRLFVVK